jgi:Zn finger protein HypA/HybF involved in hydrogenase expression
MAAHAGEKAWETGTFHCQRCNEKVRVQKGRPIPECPNCGGKTYDQRTDEPGNKSS